MVGLSGPVMTFRSTRSKHRSGTPHGVVHLTSRERMRVGITFSVIDVRKTGGGLGLRLRR